MRKKVEKIADASIILPKTINFFIRDNFGWSYNANDKQANNCEFGLMEIYKGVFFIRLS